MSYLNFDKALLINLERSLSKEMIRTNRAGAYNSTTLIDCNTRKYHGQLVLPLAGELPEDNYVLLGSLDETVIQEAKEYGLYPTRHTRVITRPGLPPKRSLFEFRKEASAYIPQELTIELERHVYSEGYIALTKDFYLKM